MKAESLRNKLYRYDAIEREMKDLEANIVYLHTSEPESYVCYVDHLTNLNITIPKQQIIDDLVNRVAALKEELAVISKECSITD